MTAKLPDTVLVTGASGFIGSVVTGHLRAHGYKVRAVSRAPQKLDLTFGERALMPAADADERQWNDLVEGTDHIVHCAGIADASARIGYTDYRIANVDLSVRLAKAALDRLPGRFVFLSSIRAIAGSVSREILLEETPPQPEDDYGRSKLEAEARLAEVFAAQRQRLVALRPVAVYGEGMRGSLSSLQNLTRLPFPLPVAGIKARKSLLDVERLAAAVLHALSGPAVAGGTYIVSDRNPLTLAEVVAAMREGHGRSPGVFALPEPVLATLCGLVGRGAMWERLSGSLVASPDRLAATGWHPAEDTCRRLTAYTARHQAAG